MPGCDKAYTTYGGLYQHKRSKHPGLIKRRAPALAKQTAPPLPDNGDAPDPPICEPLVGEQQPVAKRPRGRAPGGKVWDDVRGMWVAQGELLAAPAAAPAGGMRFIDLEESDPPDTLAAATAAAEALGLQVRQRGTSSTAVPA